MELADACEFERARRALDVRVLTLTLVHGRRRGLPSFRRFRVVGVPRRTPPRPFGPLTVIALASPNGQWTPEQAADLLAQGYTVDRVVDLTGYDRRWVVAQDRRLSDPQTA